MTSIGPSAGRKDDVPLPSLEELKRHYQEVDAKITPFVRIIGAHTVTPHALVEKLISLIHSAGGRSPDILKEIDLSIGDSRGQGQAQATVRLQALYDVSQAMQKMASKAEEQGNSEGAKDILRHIPEMPMLSILTQLVNTQDEEGNTPLFLAAINGRIKPVGDLLSIGARVDIKNKEGGEPLHYAVCGEKVENVLLIVESLLGSAANPNAQNTIGETALHYLLEDGEEEILLPVLERLLLAGADLTITTNDGKSILDYAKERGNEAVIAAIKQKLEID
ncbi:MAG: ankyrin repeat domain-containing protein [Chlamydiales bacterium]|nr:ankyrin repeat domain-containing protein [Chlamydiales bacterium]